MGWAREHLVMIESRESRRSRLPVRLVIIIASLPFKGIRTGHTEEPMMDIDRWWWLRNTLMEGGVGASGHRVWRGVFWALRSPFLNVRTLYYDIYLDYLYIHL